MPLLGVLRKYHVIITSRKYHFVFRSPKFLKGLIGKLKIKDVEKIVYIPVVVEKQEGGATVSGRLLIDLLDYNFVPRKQYIPEEGHIKLPFTLSFKLVFNSVPSC